MRVSWESSRLEVMKQGEWGGGEQGRCGEEIREGGMVGVWGGDGGIPWLRGMGKHV